MTVDYPTSIDRRRRVILLPSTKGGGLKKTLKNTTKNLAIKGQPSKHVLKWSNLVISKNAQRKK